MEALHLLSLELAAVEVVGALEAEDIPSLVLKGPGLARLLYASNEVRQTSDADILVPPGLRREAEAVLRTCGFEGPEFEAVAHRVERHATAFRRAVDRVEVDLHHTVLGVVVDPEIVWDELSRDARTLEVAGGNIPIPRDAALAWGVVIHATQSGERIVKPLRDLARAIERLPMECWQEALGIAERLDCVTAFSRGLRMLPEGEELARQLHLPDQTTVDAELRVQTPPVTALAWNRLLSTPGLKGKAAVAWRELFPPRRYVRAWWSFKPRPDRPLAFMYLARWLHMLRDAPRALRAVRRARRRSR